MPKSVPRKPVSSKKTAASTSIRRSAPGTARPSSQIANARRGGEAKRVYEALKASILSLEFAPGASLDEAKLVASLGVSRTPVREAIIRLEAEGLVTVLPNRGASVAPLDLARIKDYLEGVDLIQRAVTRWAAVRCSKRQLETIKAAGERFESSSASGDTDQMVLSNHEFHALIAEACGNTLVAESYRRLLDEGLRIARFTLNPRYYLSAGDYKRFVDSVVNEHRLMIRAIATRDPEAAERVAADHTEHTRARFVGYLYESLASSIPADPQDAAARPI
jgi:DNA-binding GntR family transcriptional regulator